MAALIPVFTMLQDYDAAEQIAADRLPDFQGKDTDRMCGLVTRHSISCFVTAGLWPRSGYWDGHVSETKGDAVALGRPR